MGVHTAAPYCQVTMSLRRVIIATKKAPDAIGPYNQAVQVNTTLYISGQIGVVPETRQALTNMGHILEAANCTFDNVVKTTVLLANINDFAAVNEVYTTFFSDNYPARAAYQVAALPRGARVEIEAVAVVGDIVTVQ